MKKRNCEHCLYWRGTVKVDTDATTGAIAMSVDQTWCSNSKSPFMRYSTAIQQFIKANHTCAHFESKEAKAPLLMRLSIRALSKRKSARGK